MVEKNNGQSLKEKGCGIDKEVVDWLCGELMAW
jgi:hypothetical protein